MTETQTVYDPRTGRVSQRKIWRDRDHPAVVAAIAELKASKVVYTQADWEGAQDDIENAFIALKRDAANDDLLMLRHSAKACKGAIKTCVSVAAYLGHAYDGSEDMEALRAITWSPCSPSAA